MKGGAKALGMWKKIVGKVREGYLKAMLQELRWIYRYARRYRVRILTYMGLGLLASALAIGASLLSRDLTGAVLESGRAWGDILFLGGVYVFLGLASVGLEALNSRVSTLASVKIQNEMQADIFRSVLRSQWTTLQEYHSGDLLNRLTGDVSTVSQSVFSLLPSLVIRLFQFGASLALILRYDPIMAALALLSAPAVLLTSRVLVRGMREHQQEMRGVSSDLMAFQQETLQNIQPIKAFGLTGRFGRRLEEVQEEYARAALEFNRFSILTSTFLSLIGQGVSYVCLAWGVYRLWSGYIDLATMVMFLQLAAQLAAAFSALIGLAPGAISATVSARRILEVLDIPAEPELTGEEGELVRRVWERSRKEGVTLRLNRVRFGYERERPVLREASMEARPGEIIVLLGPSGEGKTTLLRLLLGLTVPQEGTGTVEVEDITYTVDVIPEGNLDAEPIFRFSKAFGVVDSDDLCGEPVYMTVEGADIIPEPAEVEEKKKSNKYEGVIYNIPGMAHVSLFTKDATLIERDVMIAQFGTTEVLTNNLFNKKTATKVLFDDSNGGLVRIERE